MRKRTFKEKLLRLWPSYRRKQDAETKAAIRWLVDHPEAPCMIGDSFIPNGYGTQPQSRGQQRIGYDWHPEIKLNE